MRSILKYLDIKNIPNDKKRDFVSNVFLGTMLMLVFILLENTSVRQNAINHWFDYYIKLRINDDTDAKRISNEIIFLDFDNKSLRDLGRPNMIPRNKIADLLNFAYQGRAELVVIDMDFSDSDYTPERLLAGDKSPMTGLARDNLLFNLLQQIKDDSSSNTKVLLPITTYADFMQKHNIFSELIDNKKIFSVTPAFTISRLDNKVRFWMPYLETLEENGRQHNVLWSIPLLSMVLISGNFDELYNIKDDILESRAKSFALNVNHDKNKTKEKFIFYSENSNENGLIRDSQHLQYNRIQYVILPPRINKNDFSGNISPSHIGHWRKKGLDNKKINYENKIVIIGRADLDCSDFFETPIGKIPGMYIHGSSIATILGKTRPRLTALYKYIIIEILLIMAASLVFLYFSSLPAMCIIIIITGICWAGIYWYFQLTNEFIYTSFAFAGIWIYRLISRLRKFISSILGRKQK